LSLVEQSDDEEDFQEPPADPLRIEDEPPTKKLRSIDHLTKRFKGRRPKRPPGKMNDPNEDMICVSDDDVDPDDF